MANNVKPIVHPNPIVAPLKDFESFHLDDRELFLFDLYTNEHTRIIGTPIEYWSVDVRNSQKDPLYGEPKDRVFCGPFKYTIWFQGPEHTPQVREEGFTQEMASAAYLPRKMVEEAKAPMPNEGDVLHTWNLPIHMLYSMPDRDMQPNAGYYFNIIQVEMDGYLFDSPSFVGFKMTLRRRSEFAPERRVTRP